MEKRPILSLPNTKTEIVLNSFSILLLIAAFFYLFYVWNDLPEKVPAHFNAAGKVDRWGGKGNDLVFPTIGFLIFILLFFLGRFPHTFNYPVKITDENASRIYLEARRLTVFLNFELVLIFSIGTWDMVQTAFGRETISMWYIPLLLILVFGTLAIFIIRMVRMK